MYMFANDHERRMFIISGYESGLIVCTQTTSIEKSLYLKKKIWINFSLANEFNTSMRHRGLFVIGVGALVGVQLLRLGGKASVLPHLSRPDINIAIISDSKITW